MTLRNFHKIGDGLDPRPMLQALWKATDLWNANTIRQDSSGNILADADDILIRYPDTSAGTAVIGTEAPMEWQPAATRLPWRPLAVSLMATVGAYQLDRMTVTRLPPGGVIKPHTDNFGQYAHHRDRERYHIVLQGLPGSSYTCGDETVEMRTGEVWAFRPLLMHSVANRSPDDRLHLIADLRLLPH